MEQIVDRLVGVVLSLHPTNRGVLEASYQLALTAAIELMSYCRRLGMPFGINIESVSIRKVEIEASVMLAAHLRDELRSGAVTR